MANPTTNFGWQMPTNTDLVKDLPADFETFGQAVDTSMADLKGGTTGQILSKNSGTDMDFIWIDNDQGDITAVNVTSPITGGGTAGAVTVGIQDGTTAQKGAVQLENSTSSTSTTTAAVPASVKSAYDLANAAIPKSLVDAAGDTLYATANDTVARLGIGSAGQVLTVNTGATAPEWKTITAGGFTLLSTTTLTGAQTFSFTGISGSYQHLLLVLNGVAGATNGRQMTLDTVDNVTMLASSIRGADATASAEAFDGTTAFVITDYMSTSGASIQNKLSGFIWFYGYNNNPIVWNAHMVNYKDTRSHWNTAGTWSNSWNGFKIAMDSGNFDGGTARLYGVQ